MKTYSTLTGVTADEIAGDIYVEMCGTTNSADFPSKDQPGVSYDFRSDFVSNLTDGVFVSFKNDAEYYSTHYASTHNTVPTGIVANKGIAYMTGYTSPSSLPVKSLPNAYNQDTYTAQGNGFFLAQFTYGATLDWSTYVDGKKLDIPWGITVDMYDHLYVTGNTSSYQVSADPQAGFPLVQDIQDPTGAYFQNNLNSLPINQISYYHDAFITEFNISPKFLLSVPVATENDNLIIYPNPTSSILKIRYNFVTSNGRIEIFNTLGQKVYESNYLQDEINVSDLTSGVYLLHIEKNGRNMSSRFVKQ